MGTESRGKGIIDQEDALRIFAISVGENYSASNTGVVQPNAETPIKLLYKWERSGVARLSLGGLFLSLSFSIRRSFLTLRRVSLSGMLQKYTGKIMSLMRLNISLGNGTLSAPTRLAV